MNNILYLFVFVITLVSCKSKQENIVDNYKIPVDKNYDLSITNIASQVDFIPLETNDDVLVGDFQPLKVDGDLLFINDIIQKCIFSFQSNGKFYSKIGKPGRGRGEILEVSGYCLDKNKKEVIIWDNGNKRRSYFNYEGEFLYNERVLVGINFTLLDDSTFLVDRENRSNFVIDKISKDGKIIKQYLKTQDKFKGLPIRTHTDLFFHEDDGSISFISAYDPFVYNLKGNRLTKKYKFDFGEQCVSLFPGSLYKERSEKKEALYSSKFVRRYQSFAEIDNWLYFGFSYKRQSKRVLINKNTKEIFVFKNLKLLPDTDSDFWFLLYPQEGELYGVSVMSNLLKAYESLSELQKKEAIRIMPNLKKVVENSIITDNPVVIKMTLRDANDKK